MRAKPAAVVLDSNVLLKTVLMEAYSQEVTTWLQGAGDQISCHAPSWIFLECAHTLQKAGRRFPDLYAPDQFVIDFQRLQRIDINLYAFEPYTIRAVTLANLHGISVYDGIFIALAEYLHLPFLTGDQRLITRLTNQQSLEILSVDDYFNE